jgi:hypothetical protein
MPVSHAVRATRQTSLEKPLILLIRINMAEGVVSEPLLPSGDHGRKGGFKPLPK